MTGISMCRLLWSASFIYYLTVLSFRCERVSFCAGLWTPERRNAPQAELAGVQKAPRHEVAGVGHRLQRALWRFNAGADVDDGREARTTPAAYLQVREVGRMPEAFWP